MDALDVRLRERFRTRRRDATQVPDGLGRRRAVAVAAQAGRQLDRLAGLAHRTLRGRPSGRHRGCAGRVLAGLGGTLRPAVRRQRDWLRAPTPSRSGPSRVADPGLLPDYYAAVHHHTKTLNRLTATDLDRLVDNPFRCPIGVPLVSIINDITQHLGQIGYLRGLVHQLIRPATMDLGLRKVGAVAESFHAIPGGAIADPFTVIQAIIDRSGSMESIRSDAEGGFDAFIADQRAQSGECRVSLVQFDHEYEVVYKDEPIAKVPRLRITPRGSTAMLDADRPYHHLAGRALGEPARRPAAGHGAGLHRH